MEFKIKWYDLTEEKRNEMIKNGFKFHDNIELTPLAFIYQEELDEVKAIAKPVLYTAKVSYDLLAENEEQTKEIADKINPSFDIVFDDEIKISVSEAKKRMKAIEKLDDNLKYLSKLF